MLHTELQHVSAGKGFTLISLLIGLCVTAILVVCATVSYQSFISHHQAEAIAARLVSALRFGQSEALALGGGVRFCPKARNDDICGTDWRQGQLLMSKSDHRIVRVFQKLPAQYDLQWRSRLGFNQNIDWDADGFTNGQQGSFWLYLNKDGQKRLVCQIVLLETGFVRVVNN